MNITIRGLQETIFRKFKSKAAEEDMKLGEALTKAMELWIKEGKNRPKAKFTDVPTFNWGKGTEKSSVEIDKILYG
ncbi:MAG: hypothetical protein ABR981_05350 [Candidatus Micrarchaeaceae archaeon]|jgi:hypothetical protein